MKRLSLFFCSTLNNSTLIQRCCRGGYGTVNYHVDDDDDGNGFCMICRSMCFEFVRVNLWKQSENNARSNGMK